jgi:type III secretory pathway component EscT
MRAGVTVAAAAGAVFGVMVVGLGFALLANPAPPLLAFGFMTALGSALALGFVATLVSARSLRRGAA